MDISDKIEKEIEALNKALAETPGDFSLYLQRGKCYRQKGMLAEALNDFVEVTHLMPDHSEARSHITMIRAIFSFQYMDFYNP